MPLWLPTCHPKVPVLTLVLETVTISSWSFWKVMKLRGHESRLSLNLTVILMVGGGTWVHTETSDTQEFVWKEPG